MDNQFIKGFVTENGQALYDFNSLGNVPEVLKNIPIAKVGQMLIVKSVDDKGVITSLEPVNVELSGGGTGEDGGYYALNVTQLNADTLQIEFVPSKEGMESIETQTITLPAGKDGFTPSVTVARNETNNSVVIRAQNENGFSNASVYDGKSAYQYAKDGGFTGTEAEFIEKLAQVPLIGDTTTVLPSVVHSSMLFGIPVGLTHTDPTYGTMAFSGFSYSHAANNSIVASVNFKIADVALCAQLTGNISTDEWSFSATGLALPSDIPTKVSQLENDTLLKGTTASITPTQVHEALLAGRDIVISHSHTYGTFTFSGFAHSEAFKVVFATAIVYMEDIPMAVALYGTLQDNAWTMSITSLATKNEIPTSLPTPYQLKFMPGTNPMMNDLLPIAFNGSYEQIVRIPTLTSHLENDSGFLTEEQVNSLIDEKLRTITNAEEVAF